MDSKSNSMSAFGCFSSVHTPKDIARPIVDSDVVDAKDAAEIYPPGGGPFLVIRNDTLSSPNT